MIKEFSRRYRVLTHVLFWVIYYLAFSFIWARSGNYYPSFSLEFALMPIRIGLSYYTIYYLIPEILRKQKILHFFIYYGVALCISGVIQSFITHFFYESFFLGGERHLITIGSVFRAMLLVNSTVLFLSAGKLYFLWQEEMMVNNQSSESFINIKADKRIHRIKTNNILYLEGLGNYLKIFLGKGEHLIAYNTLKELEGLLPGNFIRTHKSYIVNRDKISSFTKENVKIHDKLIPLGKGVVIETILQYKANESH